MCLSACLCISFSSSMKCILDEFCIVALFMRGDKHIFSPVLHNININGYIYIS